MDKKIEKIFPAGFCAALPTPLKKNGEIDGDGITALVENALQQGLIGLYVGGSTGEGFLLSPEERAQLFEAVASASAGRLKLIAQVGAMELAAAEQISASAAHSGFDYVSTTPPLYFRHSNEEMTTYYRTIQQAANLPLVLYEVPALTGRSLPNSFFVELAKEMPLAGIKYTSTDIVQLVDLCSRIEDVAVFYGVDEMLVAGLASGAHGGIGSTYNLFGHRYIELAQRLMSGDVEGAARLQAEVNLFIDVLVKFEMPASLKACLEIKGLCNRHVKRPFKEVQKDDMRLLETALNAIEDA